MQSTSLLRIVGVIVAVIDLAFGLYILGTHAQTQYEKYHCHWAHGIRSCDYFIHETNFNTRTIIGIASGFFSIIFSIILIFAFLKRKPLLGWTWLLKAVAVLAIDVFFLSGWLIRRGRFYHSYWDPDAYDEETWFIVQAAIELVVQLVLLVVFCVVNAIFSKQIKRQQNAQKAAESAI